MTCPQRCSWHSWKSATQRWSAASWRLYVVLRTLLLLARARHRAEGEDALEASDRVRRAFVLRAAAAAFRHLLCVGRAGQLPADVMQQTGGDRCRIHPVRNDIAGILRRMQPRPQRYRGRLPGLLSLERGLQPVRRLRHVAVPRAIVIHRTELRPDRLLVRGCRQWTAFGGGRGGLGDDAGAREEDLRNELL